MRLRYLALALSLGSLWLLTPFAGWLLLAVWFADLCRVPHRRLARLLGGHRRWAASLFTVLLVLIVLGPTTTVLLALGSDALTLMRRIAASQNVREALANIVQSGDGSEDGGNANSLWLNLEPGRWVALAEQHGQQTLQILGTLLGTTAQLLLGAFIFLMALYAALVEGRRFEAWLLEHSPFEPKVTRRMGLAFQETGRGLFMSVVLTSLAQAILGTIAYLALGVPRAWALGLLTFIAAFVPSVGSALVWLPITAGLALTGRGWAALALLGIGSLVIGSVDNFLRPWFARVGNLQMPAFITLLSMFGGLACLGGWGLLFGPLIFRLTLEALKLRQEANADHAVSANLERKLT